jgi:hypothetical protein
MTDKEKIELIRKVANIVGNEPVEHSLSVEMWLKRLADMIERDSQEVEG